MYVHSFSIDSFFPQFWPDSKLFEEVHLENMINQMNANNNNNKTYHDSFC